MIVCGSTFEAKKWCNLKRGEKDANQFPRCRENIFSADGGFGGKDVLASLAKVA